VNYKTWIELDERALTHNIVALKGLLSEGAKFCAVLKANAYGHGFVEVARIAARCNVDAFAVDNIDEALVLRAMLPSALVLVLGYTLKERYADAINNEIHLTVYEKDQVVALEYAGAEHAKTAFIHLKIETGTARQGVLPDHLYDVLEVVGASSHVALAGVSTHFANVEDTTDTSFANRQFALFQEVVGAIRNAGYRPEWVHCSNSAATILYPDTHGSLVRVGIAMYGIWPSEIVEQTVRRHNVPLELEPVLAWKTRIAQVKSLPAGTPISYGMTEVLRKASRIAVLPVGYWDGFDRGLSSVAEVLVNGIRCKVMGRVCMNMVMVDVSAVPQVEPEQEVVLIGRSGRFVVAAEEMAAHAGTISYETLTRINPLLPRIVI